ncbi:MAG TPA: bacteriohopanetetrol glucosamine biosynthesis glycosyltransferase HpnI [Terriglobales bacterium]|nr:bacteriohopanetetrol glucosamine biosynthesis glycosyltransferase HpnI [Terriglobales bacterium]
MTVLGIAGVVGSVCASVYYLICIWSARVFVRDQKRSSFSRSAVAECLPGVSILKPLKGVDLNLYECLRSHCLQDYPEYEIIFGVSDADDPALEVVERLHTAFAGTALKVFVCTQNLGTNTKVSNLAQMTPVAKFEHLVVNDGDIQVPPDYLRKIVSSLNDSQVGLVTALYRGEAAPTMGSRLEALGIATDFAPGVLAARYLEDGIRFGLGSTLAFRRSDLNAVGGFEGFVDHLADDYELGKRLAESGKRVVLSDCVVTTFLPTYSIRGFFQHQLRWARTIRDARKGGYLGLLFTFGIPWALLAVIGYRGASWTWSLLAVVVAARLAKSFAIASGVLKDTQVVRWFWLLPIRDLAAAFIWAFSFAGHSITWRGQRYRLEEGRLMRIEDREANAPAENVVSK